MSVPQERQEEMKKKVGTLMALVLGVTTALSPEAGKGGLVGHWELDETSGTTVKDSSGNGYDGILTGGLSFDDHATVGKIGRAVHLDGSDGRSVCIESVSLPGSAFTIALWFNPDTQLDSSSERAYLMFWGGPTRPEGDKPYFEVNEDDDGKIHFCVNIAGQAQQEMLTKTASWKASTWYHIAVTFDGVDFRLYINGVEEASGRYPGKHYASRKAYFGGRSDGRRCFKGGLDDIRIYDHALSAKEIQQLEWADPALKEVVDAVAEAGRMTEQNPKEAVAFVEKKIAELERWREESGKYELISRQLFFGLFLNLAKAKEAAGFAKAEVEAAYQRAREEGLPSRPRTASVLLWLFEEGMTEPYQDLVWRLNDDKRDYLKDVAGKAERMVLDGKSEAASKFLESNIAAYWNWQQQHPFDDVPAEGRLPVVHFQMAKALEAGGAAKKYIAEAYSKTFAFSDDAYVAERTAALVWLLDNECTKEYEEIIRSFAQSGEIGQPLAGVVLNMCKDCVSKGAWVRFARLLDTIFGQARYPSEWALFVDSCLVGRSGGGAKRYTEYLESRPKLKLGRDRALAGRYVAEGKYGKAGELYEGLVSRCESNDEKRACEFELYRSMFLGGDYARVVGKLEDFIAANKADNRSEVKEAMLMKARACVQLGEFDKAVDTCFTLMMEYPEMKEMSEVSFFMGYCDMLQGNFEKAVEALNIVARDYPESSFADKARMCLTRIKNITQ